MNVDLVSGKVLSVANAMIGESLDREAGRARVASLDELHGALDCRVGRRSDQQMYVVGHEHESMELKTSLPAVRVKGLQEESCILFDDEESSALKSRKAHEIRAGRRHQAGRFHGDGPQRLKPRLSQTKAARLKSCPSQPGIFVGRSRFGLQFAGVSAACTAGAGSSSPRKKRYLSFGLSFVPGASLGFAGEFAAGLPPSFESLLGEFGAGL